MNKEHYTEADFITYEVLIILEARIEKAREIAINLLQAGLEVEFISKMTDLSIEEIEELPRYEGRTY
jgi:hypothetical protein